MTRNFVKVFDTEDLAKAIAFTAFSLAIYGIDKSGNFYTFFGRSDIYPIDYIGGWCFDRSRWVYFYLNRNLCLGNHVD